jgi:hypothetical protein
MKTFDNNFWLRRLQRQSQIESLGFKPPELIGITPDLRTATVAHQRLPVNNLLEGRRDKPMGFYACRVCGLPIIFRFPKQDGQAANSMPFKRGHRKPYPIHVNGKCGQYGFNFSLN